MPCVNCGADVTSAYCSNCGQRVTVKRLTFREGWNDFWARIYGFDGMFPRTLRDLTIRPGLASKTYLEGNRVKYYAPVGYFFFIITLLYLVASLLNVEMIEYIRASSDVGLQESPKPGSGQEKYMQYMLQKMSDNMKLLAFAIIPFQAFCARYIFFKKSGYNFIENMVLPLYMQGHTNWLNILSVITFTITGSFISSLLLSVVVIGYFCFGYANFMTYQKFWKAFFKGFMVYLTSYIFFIIAIATTVVIIIATDKEVFEMLRPSNN
jgi:hypothetical protein